MIERIESNGELLAIVVRSGFRPEHVHYVTEDREGLQLSFQARKQGERVKAHQSLPFQNVAQLPSNKIYHLRQGKAAVDIYDRRQNQVTIINLQAGDTVIFLSGGHGITFTEDSRMMEIKQGPYRQRDNEKRFLE